MKSLILRYANIIGSKAKHGAIYDFIMNLNPKFVFKKVLEDGRGWLGDVKVMLLSIEKLKN